MIVYLARYVDLPVEPILPPALRYRLELSPVDVAPLSAVGVLYCLH